MKIISIIIIISFFQITLIKSSNIKYHKIKKNFDNYLNISSLDDQIYAYIDYEQDEGSSEHTSNKYHYLLITENLNVTCISHYPISSFPEPSFFNKSSPNDCLEIEYDNNYKIIRYNRVENKNENSLFVFYSNILLERAEVNKLLNPKELIDNHTYNISIYQSIQIYYFDMNKYDNENIIYISEPNNIIIYGQLNNFSDYTKIQNSRFYKFYNKNVQECNLYYKHIIIIVKKSNRIISTQNIRKSF